jgi:hypothetical protein
MNSVHFRSLCLSKAAAHCRCYASSLLNADAARDGLELLQGVRGFSEHMRHVAQTAAGGRYPAGAAGEEGRKPLAQHDSSIADLSIDTIAEAV